MSDTFTPHLGTVLQIIRYGMTGDAVRVKAYTELLAEKLEECGDVRGAASLRRYAAGDFGRQIIPLAGDDNSSPVKSGLQG